MIQGTILLVDDNQSDVELAQRAIKKSGITNPVLVASNGVEALELALGNDSDAAPAEVMALVLLDINMPKMDGLEVLQRLRADNRTRRLPVIMLTSSTEERDLAAAYDAGANSYLHKPVSYSEFCEAIELLGRYWLGLNQPPPRMATC